MIPTSFPKLPKSSAPQENTKHLRITTQKEDGNESPIIPTNAFKGPYWAGEQPHIALHSLITALYSVIMALYSLIITLYSLIIDLNCLTIALCNGPL